MTKFGTIGAAILAAALAASSQALARGGYGGGGFHGGGAAMAGGGGTIAAWRLLGVAGGGYRDRSVVAADRRPGNTATGLVAGVVTRRRWRIMAPMATG